MNTTEETMKVIAEGVAMETVCPVVDEIAKKAAYDFELASECAFENDDDYMILDLMTRLYDAKPKNTDGSHMEISSM